MKITDLIVMLDDNFAPTVAIDPFYWKSPEDNSLVEFSYKNGHIDLPTVEGAKLDTETGLFKHATSGLVAGDDTNKPQVSGKVSLRGTALDEHTLNSIWVAFTDKAATPVSVITPDESSYLATEAGSVYYKVAQKDTTNGEWTKASGTTWQFYIEKDESTQEGQVITWRLVVDTSKMNGSMGTNKVFRVMARDDAYGKTGKENADHQSASGTLGRDGKYDLLIEGTNHPSYVVDVVPYISDVYTDTNTAANRSRLGRYSVQAGSTIYLKGFNFGDGEVTATRHKTDSGKAAKAYVGTITATRTDANTITITAPAYSGFVNVSITPTGGTAVKVSNNTNENTAYNIQEGYLASEETTYGANAAATAGKNFWTDDVYLSVWNSGDTFADSPNPIRGSIIGLTNTSKVYTSAREARTFANNTIYGIWPSNDNMLYNEVLGTGTDQNTRWYILSPQASGAFRSPPSESDSCIVNNNVFHTWLDDGWADANTFGNGLQIVRDGETAATDNSYIEKISDDKVRHQFQNIKIAGAYKNSKYYIYVSYYDAYTKCLKYGMMEFKNNWDQNRSSQGQNVYRADDAGSYVIDGYDAANNSNLSWDVGEFSAIKIDNSGNSPIPVVSYYDKKNGKLMIARGESTAPVSKRYGGTIGT
ncbi:MAG: hypothetical protein Q4E99_05590, partial [Bacillota bacterium]|nr:hypothetical protein [Bacillota bacterium]